MVIDDIQAALGVLRPVYDASAGADGFVSVEVAPDLAHDTDSTVAAARALRDRIAKPNLLVKVPATTARVAAIRRLFAEGRSINVTLIFGLRRYAKVIEAYLTGLEDLTSRNPQADLSKVVSVASFFVSRVTSPWTSDSPHSGPTRRPCKGEPRSPRQNWPTSCTSTPSPDCAGTPWQPGAPSGSEPSRHPPRPRTLPCPTPATSMRCLVPTPSPPCRQPRSIPSRITARSSEASTTTCPALATC